MEGGVDSVKGYVKLLSWFSILNFVVLIIFIYTLWEYFTFNGIQHDAGIASVCFFLF